MDAKNEKNAKKATPKKVTPKKEENEIKFIGRKESDWTLSYREANRPFVERNGGLVAVRDRKAVNGVAVIYSTCTVDGFELSVYTPKREGRRIDGDKKIAFALYGKGDIASKKYRILRDVVTGKIRRPAAEKANPELTPLVEAYIGLAKEAGI